MKKLKFLVAAFIAVVVLYACSGEVKPSPEMKDFTTMLDGKVGCSQAALTKFSSDTSEAAFDFGMKDFKFEKISKKEDDCYTVDLKENNIPFQYKICWANGKIIKLEEVTLK